MNPMRTTCTLLPCLMAFAGCQPSAVDDEVETDGQNCNAYTCTTGSCAIGPCLVSTTLPEFTFGHGGSPLGAVRVAFSQDPTNGFEPWIPISMDTFNWPEPHPNGTAVTLPSPPIGRWYMIAQQKDADVIEEDWYDCITIRSNLCPDFAPPAPGFDPARMIVIDVLPP